MKVVDVSSVQEFSSQKMKKHNLFETARFFCDVYCFEPGQEQQGHVHADQDKVYMVLHGTGTFTVGGEPHVLAANQAIMAPAGEEHGVVNHSGERLRVLVFMAPNPS